MTKEDLASRIVDLGPAGELAFCLSLYEILLAKDAPRSAHPEVHDAYMDMVTMSFRLLGRDGGVTHTAQSFFWTFLRGPHKGVLNQYGRDKAFSTLGFVMTELQEALGTHLLEEDEYIDTFSPTRVPVAEVLDDVLARVPDAEATVETLAVVLDQLESIGMDRYARADGHAALQRFGLL